MYLGDLRVSLRKSSMLVWFQQQRQTSAHLFADRSCGASGAMHALNVSLCLQPLTSKSLPSAARCV
jgi:hypothetical protein